MPLRLGQIGTAGPPASGVWQADLTPLAVRIEADAVARPAATLVVENGVVLDVDLQSEPPSEAEATAAELERVIARTANRTGGWPHRVEVRDAEVARQLSPTDILVQAGDQALSKPRTLVQGQLKCLGFQLLQGHAHYSLLRLRSTLENNTGSTEAHG